MFDRTSGLGGSDVAAVLGLSRYRSPFDVWLEKTHDPAWQPSEDNPMMRFGRLVEPALARAYMEDKDRIVVQGVNGGPFDEPIWHPGGVVFAHPDGLVEDDGTDGGGVWEGKTAYDDRDWKDGVPPGYEAQVRSYLATLGEPWCDVTVMFRQTADINHYRIDADPVLDAGIITLAERFWNDYVMTGIQPPMDGSPAVSRFLLDRFPRQTTEEVMTADERLDEIARQLASDRHGLAILESSKANAENAIKAAMGEYGRIAGTGWAATWRRSKGATRVGWQEVAAGYRGLLSQVEQALLAGRPEEALRVLADTPPESILSLYQVESDGTRPFIFKAFVRLRIPLYLLRSRVGVSIVTRRLQ